MPCVSLPMDEDDDDRVVVGAMTRRRESLPAVPATKEDAMDFDEDCSSETEFDEDCSSETEFDEDCSLETVFDVDSSSETEFDVDAEDFDGNDTNVYFIVKEML